MDGSLVRTLIAQAIEPLEARILELQEAAPLIVSGTPEGVVVAPVGRLAVDIAGGAGTVLYVKESGTGSTGWVAK